MVPEQLRDAYPACRLTPQRREIAEAVGRMPGAFSAADLAACLREGGAGTGLATVYRALSALEASGWVARAGERDGAVLFAHCGVGDHHHHLVCTGCGRVEHAPCVIEEALCDVARATGFVITDHDVTLYGLCAACGARDDAS